MESILQSISQNSFLETNQLVFGRMETNQLFDRYSDVILMWQTCGQRSSITRRAHELEFVFPGKNLLNILSIEM